MYAYGSNELAQIVAGVWQSVESAPSVRSFNFDARRIQAGECFVALTGGARDGHDFVEQAAKAGAAAALVERIVDVEIPQLLVRDTLLALGAVGAAARARFEQPVVGVTGSCGKTSTKEMLRVLLGQEQTHVTAGNLNNRIGVPLTLLGLDSAQHQFGVIEAGINQPDEMHLLGAMIHADVSVVTNVGPAHLELLETVNMVAQEKARLALEAIPDSPVVIPSDLLQYPVFSSMADRLIVLHPEGVPLQVPKVRKLLTYTLSGRSEHSTSYELAITDEGLVARYHIETPSQGIATNAALAITVARIFGVEHDACAARIAQWRPAANRGRVVTVEEQQFYVDCYNANPASMLDALLAFAASMDASLPRVYVLGAMNELGPTAADQHRQVGAQLKLRPQDVAYFVGPDALVAAYQAGALSAGIDSAQLNICETIERVHSGIADFKGALFLKGSRSYQLETLLPATP